MVSVDQRPKAECGRVRRPKQTRFCRQSRMPTLCKKRKGWDTRLKGLT
jgi:hypothetical protein